MSSIAHWLIELLIELTRLSWRHGQQFYYFVTLLFTVFIDWLKSAR